MNMKTNTLAAAAIAGIFAAGAIAQITEITPAGKAAAEKEGCPGKDGCPGKKKDKDGCPGKEKEKDACPAKDKKEGQIL